MILLKINEMELTKVKKNNNNSVIRDEGGYIMYDKLVIVESPSKSKTIENYLGK